VGTLGVKALHVKMPAAAVPQFRVYVYMATLMSTRTEVSIGGAPCELVVLLNMKSPFRRVSALSFMWGP
jgi:hypothetical protein